MSKNYKEINKAETETTINVLYSETVETIRRITRFAQRLAEERQSMKNRHTDYLKLANWFAEIDDVNKAREPLYTSRPDLERSGMGFTVMESFMDSLEVESQKDKGTRIIMTKKFS